MLIDEVEIKINAGKGGDGVVAFNKNAMALGPTGGSGGKGGEVYLQGVFDIGALRRFQFQKEFWAKGGKDGRSQFRDGSDGEDLLLFVPVGTVVYNLENGNVFEISKINEKILLAKGGKGGKGNFLFRSSTRTSPEISKRGEEGESFRFRMELKLIADVGFIGLPNVGKSSLLNELTGSKSKVANYAFTTLEPALGVCGDLIIADIPGLIKGASGGKGLGVKFLKHVERTKVLFHFVSAESSSPIKDYEIVRRELKLKNEELLKKQEYIIVSKRDTVSDNALGNVLNKLKKKNKNVIAVSAIDDKSIKEVSGILNQVEKKKKAEE